MEPIETTTEQGETVEAQGQEESQAEKMLSQSEVNALLAKERRAATVKYNALQSQYEALQKGVADKKEAELAIVQERVSKLREGQPQHVLSLLDKLDPHEQLEWLSVEENRTPKKMIPKLPDERKEAPKKSSFRVTGI